VLTADIGAVFGLRDAAQAYALQIDGRNLIIP